MDAKNRGIYFDHFTHVNEREFLVFFLYHDSHNKIFGFTIHATQTHTQTSFRFGFVYTILFIVAVAVAVGFVHFVHFAWNKLNSCVKCVGTDSVWNVDGLNLMPKICIRKQHALYYKIVSIHGHNGFWAENIPKIWLLFSLLNDFVAPRFAPILIDGH